MPRGRAANIHPDPLAKSQAAPPVPTPESQSQPPVGTAETLDLWLDLLADVIAAEVYRELRDSTDPVGAAAELNKREGGI